MKPPVIIIGAPRSGTTILGEILSHHSELHYLIEPNLIWRRYVSSECDYFDLAREKEAVEPTRAQFYKGLKKSGKTRLLEKTPQNCLRLPFVHEVFPDAKFIHIIRDGVESSLSISKFWQTHTSGLGGVRLSQRLREASIRQLPHYGMQFVKRMLPAGDTPRVYWGPVLPGMPGIVKAHSILEVAAMQWRMCVDLATQYGRTMPPEQYLELRLEDFNEQALASIMSFAELPHEGELFNVAKERFNSDQTSHRSCAAAPADIQVLKRWLDPTMNWLGQLD
jgi:hypothetical protein